MLRGYSFTHHWTAGVSAAVIPVQSLLGLSVKSFGLLHRLYGGGVLVSLHKDVAYMSEGSTKGPEECLGWPRT